MGIVEDAVVNFFNWLLDTGNWKLTKGITMNELSQDLTTTLRELGSKVDSVRETAIRTESKLEAYSTRTNHTEAELKAHDLRLNEVENKVSNQEGGMRMLQWVGGVIGGLVLIGQLAVMIIKG